MNDDIGGEHDLADQLLRLTYDRLVADTAQHAGASAATARWQPPRRFVSRGALAEARSLIAHACRRADADSEFAEFFTTHWLRQFEPRPM